MSQFFTTIDKNESKFVGLVHDSNTLQVLYRSAEHETQEQALEEINRFVSSNQISSSSTTATTTNNPITAPPSRGCGCGRNR